MGGRGGGRAVIGRAAGRGQGMAFGGPGGPFGRASPPPPPPPKSTGEKVADAAISAGRTAVRFGLIPLIIYLGVKSSPEPLALGDFLRFI